MQFNRARIINQAYVKASAESAWEVLTDWHNINRISTPESVSGPLSLSKAALEGQPEQVPRTRVLYFEDENLAVVRETLLREDNEAMHLYYNIEGTGPMGMRNYLATTDVDRISDEICQVTITARFDLPAEADMQMAKTIINTAHLGVIKGLQYNLGNSDS